MGDAPRPSVALRVDLGRRLRPLASVGFKMYPRDSNFDDVFDEAMAVMKRSHTLADIIVVRQGQTCFSPVEFQYYKGVCPLNPVCCWCAGETVDPPSRALQQRWSFVFPTCSGCRTKFDAPTRGEKKVGTFADRADSEDARTEAMESVGHAGAAKFSRQVSKRRNQGPPEGRGRTTKRPTIGRSATLQIGSHVTFTSVVNNTILTGEDRIERGSKGVITDAVNKEGQKSYQVKLEDGKLVTCLGAALVLSEVFEHVLEEEVSAQMDWDDEDQFTEEVEVVAAILDREADSVTLTV